MKFTKDKKITEYLNKIGISFDDQNIIQLLILIILSLLSFEIFDIRKVFNHEIFLLIVFEIINLAVWYYCSKIFERLKKNLESEGYSLFKYRILKFFIYTMYFFLIIMVIPKIIFNNTDLSKALINIYLIFFFLLTVMVYPLVAIVPYTYSREYQDTRIGTFFSKLSQKDLNIEDLSSIINDNDKLNIFLRPVVSSKLDSINGTNIIQNLYILKQKNIDTYFKLKVNVKLKNDPPFWNLGSIFIAILSILSTLASHNFFVDVINAFTPGKGDKINNINFTVEIFIGILFLLICISLIKVGLNKVNQAYYERMLMYFNEIEE